MNHCEDLKEYKASEERRLQSEDQVLDRQAADIGSMESTLSKTPTITTTTTSSSSPPTTRRPLSEQIFEDREVQEPKKTLRFDVSGMYIVYFTSWAT
jgi:hypothetical protein